QPSSPSFSHLDRPTPISPLFPYTTLFRSGICQRAGMLPGNDRLRRRAAHGERRHDGVAIFGFRRSALSVETRHKTIFDLMRIGEDRKSTRLNSSHVKISYAVFCLKKKKKD